MINKDSEAEEQNKFNKVKREAYREMDINVSDMMACGGGGSSPLWRSMLADLYNSMATGLVQEFK